MKTPKLSVAELKKARLKFLNGTVKFYSKDIERRAIAFSGCAYSLRGEKHCAIGRHLPEKLCNILDGLDDGQVSDMGVFRRLPLKLKVLGSKFLESVQNLHDVSHNWSKETGLSELGKREVEGIKNRFKLN